MEGNGCTKCDNRTLVQTGPYYRVKGCSKLDLHDWLQDIEWTYSKEEIVEVRFKNTRKDFYYNENALRLKPGDIVAVEANPGHDIGIVSLTGHLVHYQMHKKGNNQSKEDLKKIYRKAKENDLEKWQQAISLEHETMLKSRKIADDLKLDMKIGDVEYQGDHTKAIFYYIADERVDFRELIKVLAGEFSIRIEMRQIGARQEAGRIGGIGSCGRELCCATWITNFVSVTTNAARYQEMALNPQKLAGQCGKLKCCLNYELACYLDAQRDFPDREAKLEMTDGTLYHQKTDIYRGIFWYSYDRDMASNLVPIPVERVKEIIRINQKGQKAPSHQPELMKDEEIKFTGHSAPKPEERSLSTKASRKKKRHKKRKRDKS